MIQVSNYSKSNASKKKIDPLRCYLGPLFEFKTISGIEWKKNEWGMNKKINEK